MWLKNARIGRRGQYLVLQFLYLHEIKIIIIAILNQNQDALLYAAYFRNNTAFRFLIGTLFFRKNGSVHSFNSITYNKWHGILHKLNWDLQ
jgi:hypothetical protein